LVASLKIVIVDANPIRAAILGGGLNGAGYVNVVRIENISRLLARIYAIDPDVILIDLENPSRDVLEQMPQTTRSSPWRLANPPMASGHLPNRPSTTGHRGSSLGLSDPPRLINFVRRIRSLLNFCAAQ
jgi:CheY-like chemotaxis protein